MKWMIALIVSVVLLIGCSDGNVRLLTEKDVETAQPEKPQITTADSKSGLQIFTLPELGENVESGSVTKILVSVGDRVKKDQNVLELETEKAVVEIPVDISGKVQKIFISEGDEITVGQQILEISIY